MSHPYLLYTGVSTVQVIQPRGYTRTTMTLQDGLQRSFTGSLSWDPSAGVVDGGLDAGVEAVSTWYYLYLVPRAVNDDLLHVRGSTTSPTVGAPTGYTNYKYIGAVRNDAAANLLKAHQTGNRFDYDDELWIETIALGVDAVPVATSMIPWVPLTAEVALMNLYGSSANGWSYYYVDGGTGPYAGLKAETNGNHAFVEMPLPTVARQFWRQRVNNVGLVHYANGWLDAWLR